MVNEAEYFVRDGMYVLSANSGFESKLLSLYFNVQLGLENLQLIHRGGVRIQKNNKLCYLDSVNWESLGKVSTLLLFVSYLFISAYTWPST